RSGDTDSAEARNSVVTASTGSAQTAPPSASTGRTGGTAKQPTRYIRVSGQLRRLVAHPGTIAWLVLGLWLLLMVPVFLRATADQRSLIDFLSYRRAADAVVVGGSPYESVAQTR